MAAKLVFPKSKNSAVNVRVPRILYDMLKNKAEANNISISLLARLALQQAVESSTKVSVGVKF